MVVAVEGIGAAGGLGVSGRLILDLILCTCLPQACIMFQDIMAVEIIPVQSQESSHMVKTVEVPYSVKNVALGSGLAITA